MSHHAGPAPLRPPRRRRALGGGAGGDLGVLGTRRPGPARARAARQRRSWPRRSRSAHCARSPSRPRSPRCTSAWSLIDVPAGSLFPFVMLLAAVFTVAAALRRARRARRRRARARRRSGLEIAVESQRGRQLRVHRRASSPPRGSPAAGCADASRAPSTSRRARGSSSATARPPSPRSARGSPASCTTSWRTASASIVIQAQAAQERRRRRATEPQRRRCASIEQTGRQALTEKHACGCLGLLRSEDEELALAPQPSLRYLDRLVAQVSDARAARRARRPGRRRRLAARRPPVRADRIVQEALTNALKHAGPPRARVRIPLRPRRQLDLEISDDGAGAAAAPAGPKGTASWACASA